MKDMEPCVNNLFTKTKEWKEFYLEEINDWRQMESSVKDHICADYQQQIENLRKPDMVHGRLAVGMANRLADVHTVTLNNLFPLQIEHSDVQAHKKNSTTAFSS